MEFFGKKHVFYDSPTKIRLDIINENEKKEEQNRFFFFKALTCVRIAARIGLIVRKSTCITSMDVDCSIKVADIKLNPHLCNSFK